MPIFARMKTACARWQSWATIAAVALASFALGTWEYRGYLYERELARETLERQAHSVADALIGGIRGHRNRGAFFADQLQGSVDGLVEASDILAVAIYSNNNQPLISAGKVKLLDTATPTRTGHAWEPSAYRYARLFELLPSQTGPHGAGFSGGRGRGWRLWREPESSDTGNPKRPFASSGEYAAVLVLDRGPTDARCKRAAWLRAFVVLAGLLLLIGGSLAWRVAVRTAARSRMLEAEARHLRELSQAAAGLAHETRNPLGLIRGWTQRLAQSGLPLPEQQQADAVIEECDRVTSRINQFLAFARPAEPVLERVPLKDVLDELALLMEPDLEAKQVTLSLTDVIPEQTIRADRELLRQALFNLIQNAVQASPEGGTVEIGVRRGQDGSQRIEVADHGSGVAAEAVDSLFTPYYTTRPDGTGLGLAVVRQIANAHGWEAGHTQRTDGGAVFWLDRIDA